MGKGEKSFRQDEEGFVGNDRPERRDTHTDWREEKKKTPGDRLVWGD